MNPLEVAQQGFVPPVGLCIGTQGFICEEGPEPPVSEGGAINPMIASPGRMMNRR